jgi:hypothetical protein
MNRCLIATAALACTAVACGSTNNAATTATLTANVQRTVGVYCRDLDGVRVVVRDEHGRIAGVGQLTSEPVTTTSTYPASTSTLFSDPQLNRVLEGQPMVPDVTVTYHSTIRVDHARFYAISIGVLQPYVVSGADLQAQHWQLNYTQPC